MRNRIITVAFGLCFAVGLYAASRAQQISGSGGGTPGGANTQVQFNDSGAFGGDSKLVFNKTTGVLSVSAGTASTTNLILGAASAQGVLFSLDGGGNMTLNKGDNSAQANLSVSVMNVGSYLSLAGGNSFLFSAGGTAVFGSDATPASYFNWAGQSRVSAQFDKIDTTLANVTGLSVSVAAGRKYHFRAVLFCTSAGAGGAKVAIAGTATATAIRYGAKTYTGATLNAQNQATALGTVVGASTTAVDLIEIEGLITVNTGGTLTVQFAQNAASGTSSVLVGSHFYAFDVQ